MKVLKADYAFISTECMFNETLCIFEDNTVGCVPYSVFCDGIPQCFTEGVPFDEDPPLCSGIIEELNRSGSVFYIIVYLFSFYLDHLIAMDVTFLYHS